MTMEIIKFLADIGFSPLNLVLVAMLYFMGAHSGLFPKFWGESGDQHRSPSLRDLHESVRKLEGYFNHNTTDRLKKIDDGVENIKTKQEAVYKKVERVENQHEIWNKYGIKVDCREKT